MIDLPEPFFVLAPMDDVTDTVFRQIVADCAPPDLFITEFVNVDGLQSPGREKLLPKLKFSDSEKPIIAQLWGKIPENYYKTAKELVKMGFDGIDINMGCPVKAVVKNGCCVALVSNRELAGDIIQAVKAGVADGLKHLDAAQGESAKRSEAYKTYVETSTVSSQRSDAPEEPAGVGGSASKQGSAVLEPGHFPVSVKTRLGLGEIDYTWHEFLLNQKLNMLTIHGRTAKQMSKVPANWGAVAKIRQMRDDLSPTTLIVGNGDVIDRRHGEQLAKQHKLDGIMLGRGIFHDPFVFAKKSPWAGMSRAQKLALYKKHVQLFAKTWSSGKRNIYTLNKFCKIYINGFDGAKEMREQLMKAKNTKELLALL